MARFLLVDIGAGTMDVLCYDADTDLHYKAVVKSPVRYVAETTAAKSGNLLVTGCEMGGGPITQLLKDRARTEDVVISASAAATLLHHLSGSVIDLSERYRSGSYASSGSYNISVRPKSRKRKSQ